ncbi:hypothetical protein PHYPSEUDO_010193 [Phytophthora pseudosyringae]|uniref:Calmodulin n=1 Tax=Phytophthora pseudosyringae TaxID=221518 RepID=A0A8T1W9X9_9STRA|nr:hypothetical protein PHYPSEUDO_010193 [Phytophthora pseudosyringae]
MEEELASQTQPATWDEYTAQEQAEQEDRTSHWVESISDSGEAYFTNVVTGETSWTKPGSEFEQHGQSAIWTGDATDLVAIHEEETAAAPWEVAEMQVDDDAVVVDQEDASPNAVGEVTQWLELYDPKQQTVFYFEPQSGEVRWELLLDASALVRHCNSDTVLSMVVSLQSAARSQQARARVAALRQEKMREQQPEDCTIGSATGHAEVSDDTIADPAPSSTQDPAAQNDDFQWVEVYDPATQEHYLSPRTSETRWDPPDSSVSASGDRMVAAATWVQSLSRGRQARKQVDELRAHSGNHRSFGLGEDKSEREATCRREMNHEELLQLQGGDRFWGLDSYEREILQRQIEDELMARTQTLNVPSSSTSPQQPNEVNITVDFPDFEEEEVDPERLQQEQQEEESARLAMHHEETQQCQNGDSFWGIQAEEARQNAANIAMAQEETASRRFAENVLEQALSATWEAEALLNATNIQAARGGQEERMQAKYLRWFYERCASVDELLGYRWPTIQQQGRLGEASSPVKRRRHPVAHSNPESGVSATPYPLDDLVFRERLEHGDLRYGLRSILTVHHQSARGTSGTHFEITKASPECAFDEVTAAALLKSHLLACFPDQGMNGDEGSLGGFDRLDDRTGDGSQEGGGGSSINYRRPRMPDPHIPARFNGVPYKPNQISPTREILSGDHRKLNQLPSLAKLEPSAEAPKICQLQKAKTKARAKAKTSTGLAHQSPNNRNDSDSVREREDDQDVDTEDGGPHAQFKRQEHEVLSKLFALMDLDGSGTVNQDEMRWALQRDAEIHALATTSPLLRLLLKQRTRLDALFSNRALDEPPNSDTDEASRIESSNELSWDEFLARCELSYLRLMSEGLIQPDAVASEARTENRSRGASNKPLNDGKNKHRDEYPEPSTRETEAQTIRRVFALLDIDQDGVLAVAEVQQALYNSAATTPKSASGPEAVAKELRALVVGSRALQPMLHQKLFMSAFTKFEPMDQRGINEEEFVAFCLEIAHVAAANNMMENVE